MNFITIICVHRCNEIKISISDAIDFLKKYKVFSFGKHVKDDVAFAQKYLIYNGWKPAGRPDKMYCPIHRGNK